MYSRECTGASTGAFADTGTVPSVHCVVCSVLPGTGEDLAVEIVLAQQFFQNQLNFFCKSSSESLFQSFWEILRLIPLFSPKSFSLLFV